MILCASVWRSGENLVNQIRCLGFNPWQILFFFSLLIKCIPVCQFCCCCCCCFCCRCCLFVCWFVCLFVYAVANKPYLGMPFLYFFILCIQLDSFSMCMSYGFNQLWTGQKDGTLHVLDATHGKFDIVEVSMNWGLRTNPGSLHPCSHSVWFFTRDHSLNHCSLGREDLWPCTGKVQTRYEYCNCTLLCCDWITYVPALWNKSWLWTLPCW